VQRVKRQQTGIYKRTVERELDRVKAKFGEGPVFKVFEKFTIDMKVKDGLSDHRIMFYLAKLRPMAIFLDKKFLDPSEDDLKLMIDAFARKGISPRSVEDYKQTAKKFYSWLLSPQRYKRACGWIKVRSNVDRLKKSEDMITEEEIGQLVEACRNLRDKALVTLAYDSGCRVGELLTLRIKDLEMDDRGMMVHVSGKTGERTVYVIGDSIAYLREWRKVHPHGSNGDSALFVDLVTGEPMNYDAARIGISKAVKRAGIKKRVHLHLFRHSYATRYSEVLSESVLKAQMGWTGSSRMAQKYVHLSAQQQKNAVLTANGFEPEVKTIKHASLITCKRCGEKNPSTAEYCMKCWFPLTTKASLELRERQERIERSLVEQKAITEDVQRILERIPEEEKTGILAAIVEDLLKKKKSEEDH
jgi:integrase/ribosomal protein L40E